MLQLHVDSKLINTVNTHTQVFVVIIAVVISAKLGPIQFLLLGGMTIELPKTIYLGLETVRYYNFKATDLITS